MRKYPWGSVEAMLTQHSGEWFSLPVIVRFNSDRYKPASQPACNSPQVMQAVQNALPPATLHCLLHWPVLLEAGDHGCVAHGFFIPCMMTTTSTPLFRAHLQTCRCCAACYSRLATAS